jgi:dolichol kinase
MEAVCHDEVHIRETKVATRRITDSARCTQNLPVNSTICYNKDITNQPKSITATERISMNFSPILLSIGPSWVTDLVALLITFVAIQALVMINGALQKRELLPTYITRKIIHIFAAPIFVLCWMLYSGSVSSRLFAAVVPLAFIVQFAAAGFGWRKDEAFVNSMSRSGDPRELLRGTMHYAIIMLITVLLFFTTGKPGTIFIPTALIMLGALAGGDGLADIVGRRYGGAKSFGIGGSKKTVAGSLAMLIGALLMSMFLLAGFSLFTSVDLGGLFLSIVLLNLLATAVEALSPRGIANILIPT